MHTLYMLAFKLYNNYKQSRRMSWFSKKLLIGKLRNYFHIEDDRNVEVSLLSKQEIRCTNLVLKPQTVNKPTMPILIKHCSIGLLEISFNSKKTEKKPLVLKIDGVKLVVRFNSRQQVEETAVVEAFKKKQRPVIEEFYKAVGSEEEYKERSFLQEELYQLKQLITEYALGQLYLQISHIDVSVEYFDRPKYFGIEIQSIDAKQELSSSFETTAQSTKSEKTIPESAENQVNCQIKGLRAYLGTKFEAYGMVNQAEIRRLDKMKKKYILDESNFAIVFNMVQFKLSVVSKSIQFNLEDILIFELLNLVQYSSAFLNSKPKLRPGEGVKKSIPPVDSLYLSDPQSNKKIKINQQVFQVSQGTLLWWQQMGKGVLDKLKRRINANIITDLKFRKYMYCLFYRYVHGAHPELQKFVDEYERFKTDMQILTYNKSILSKIQAVKSSANQASLQQQLEFFVSFVSSIHKTDNDLKRINLKKINYKEIKNSNVIVNYENCRKFIRIKEAQASKQLIINVNVHHFEVNIKRSKLFNFIKSELRNESPQTYLQRKDAILQYYCNQTIIDSQINPLEIALSVLEINSKKQTKGERKQIASKNYIALTVNSLGLSYNASDISVNIPQMMIEDNESEKVILKVTRLEFSQNNIHPEVYQYKIAAEKRLALTVDQIFVQAESKFVEKVLTIMSYISKQQVEDNNTKSSFITRFVEKKVPNHTIFNTYSTTSMEILIKSVTLSTSVFDKDRNFEINLRMIKFNNPVNERMTFGVDQVFIVRSNFKNTAKKVSLGYHSMKKPMDENVIMATTRAFEGFSSKQTMTKRVTDIVIPFMLMQLSCQDVYYACNIMNVWMKIMSNPYYFPPKSKAKKSKMPSINSNTITFAEKMSGKVKYQKSFKFQLEGIQIYLLSDNFNEENNRIIDLLLDNLTINFKSTYLEDHFNLQLRDIYIRNCLSFKTVNKEALIVSIRDQFKFGDDPVLYVKDKKELSSQQRNAKMDKDKELLLFFDPNYGQPKQVDPAIDFLVEPQISLSKCNVVTKTHLKIAPIYIFYSLEFTETMRTIFSTISGLSSENIRNYETKIKKQTEILPFSMLQTEATTGLSTDYNIDLKEIDSENQLMYASEFEEVNRVTGEIKRLNLLAVKNSSVVCTISLAQITIKHKTQPYVKRFFFYANRLIIVDTSEEAGPQPIIIDLQKNKRTPNYPMMGSFTSYNSEIMRHKEKKSAFFHLILQGPQINFLKKKVLELVNFLMIMLRQVGVMPQPDQQLSSKPKASPNDYPLRYRIQILEPKVRLFRSSLSKQGFKAVGNSIKVTNYIEEQAAINSESTLNNDQSILRGLAQQPSTDNFQHFHEIQKEGKEQIQFMSFEKEKNMKMGQVVEKIFIKIEEFHIFGVQQWQKQFDDLFEPIFHDEEMILPMIGIPLINIEFFSPEMVLNIPRLEGNLFDQDFRVLIRMSQENLSETPLLFVDNPRVQIVTRMSFRTTFTIEDCSLGINILQDNVTKPSEKLKKRIVLRLDHLTGKNELWTNNQILTELSIRDLELTTMNDVKIINRLNEEYLSDLPEIPKSTEYTNIYNYKEFREMEKDSKKLLKQLLENETANVQDGPDETKNQIDDTQGGPQERTNTEKICQWIKGMIKKCGKCCRCCRNKGDKVEQDTQLNVMETILQLGNKNESALHSQILLDSNRYKNRTAPMIYNFKDILDFQHEINWSVVDVKKKEPNMVYLNFVIRPNGQKQMYLQAKKIEVLLENSKGLIGLSTFFGRPYSISDVPDHVRKYKFNNAKPFKMLIEVDDALAEIRALNDEGKMEKISVLCDLVYDNENRGDTTIGPGISKMRVESVAKIIFMSENFKNPIDLSDSFKAIYLSQNKIPYGQNERNQSKQQILLKPHEKQDWNISFFIPAFALKALHRVIMFNFSKIHTEDQAHAEMEKKKEQEKGLMSKQPKREQLKKPRSFNHNLDKQDRKGLSDSMNLSKKVSEGQKKQQTKVNSIAEYKKEMMNKPPIPPVTKESNVIRNLYVSEITFEIESKLESSFIKSKISNIMYSELYINNKTYKRNTRKALATLNINYWNLKLGVYEPCIEPWRFRMEQDVYQRDNLSSSNFKILSEIDSWNIQDQYVNDLNVNVSIALYQTYKELMIVYEQENYDENEDCIDLTKIDNLCYDVLFDRDKTKKLKEENLQKGTKNPKVLAKLRKYFTRSFVTEGQNLKKYVKEGNKTFFNPPYLKLFVYHSYFDHFRRKKCITYRTPYRIFNATNVNLIFWFLDPKQNFRWKVIVKKFEHYAIPARIYQSDFLVHISDQFEEEPEEGCPYVSVKYLIQMRGRIKSFKKITPDSVIWKNIFKYSSAQTEKLIDYRDMIIRVGNYSFTAVNVYSKHEPREQESGERFDDELKFYDAYCILQSPIMIDNYTYLDLTIRVDRDNVIQIPQNQRIEINQNLSETVSNTIIEFENDSLHEQRQILWQNYGDTEKTIEIEKLQSIKMVISRQTTSSCLIKIFSEWNISNYTNEAFSFKCSEKLLLIDKLSFNCLSNISSKGIDICIVNEESHSKTIKPTNIADVITLAKKCRVDKDGEGYSQARYNELLQSKRQYEKSQRCGCFPTSNNVYEYVDFVINAKEDPIQPLRCQKIQFRYRYLIRNQTTSFIRLCQHETNFLIAELPPSDPNSKSYQEPTYIFYYDFIPQEYFIEIEQQGSVREGVRQSVTKTQKKLKSCKFKLDQFPGSTFIIKIKKEGAAGEVQKYEDRFHYLRFEVKKIEEETLIEIMKADEQDFPIYINNVTDHHIKIIEGDDELILKPQYRIPFAWSNLASKDYKLQVSIQGTDSKQTYQFNNKSAFEPLKIIDKNPTKKKRANKELYLRQYCIVSYDYMGINGKCLVILNLFNNKLFIHSKEQNINYEMDMSEVLRIGPSASKIELYLENNNVLQLMPLPKSMKKWIQNLQYCINSDVTDKIFFTIESYNNSRIFFFRTIGQEEFQSSKQQYSIAHLNISLISSQPEEIILLYLGNITYSQHDKQNKLNYQSLELSQSQRIITIKKFKVSNQMKDAVNPVVISQIKKSNYPFIQLRLTQEKLHLSAEEKKKFSMEKQLQLKEEEEKITHYKEITFFMDEAQVMVEAALFLKMFGLKKNFDHVTNQYAVGAKMADRDQELVQSNQGYVRPVQLVNIEESQQKEKSNPQVYINYLEIKPIKMTVSVYLEHNSEQNVKMDIISIVRYIPFGIENAIIEMQSYQFFHVFYNMNELKKQFIKYYTKQAWNQIYKNAGSYDMFVPIQLVGGVGNGVKQIFYDPIYELVKKKEIKAVGKTFCEGLLSFIVFLFGFLFKIINLAFKILAVFTFDREYKTKREAFRKQIFKSPVEGAVLGAKNFWNVFKSVFTNFTNIRRDYAGYFIFGYIFGFFVCILKIIPWAVKIVVSLYDWLYVIGLGFLNWGYYEQSAMKTRSRPRRTFYHKQIIQYNYLHSLGNEIILKNQLEQVENEQMYFVKSIEGKDDSNYLILSNYRIIHNYYKFTGMQEIKLYQLTQVSSWYFQKKNEFLVTLQLSIPNMHKILFLFSYAVKKYKLHFKLMTDTLAFTRKLKFLCMHQKLDVRFEEGKELHNHLDRANDNNDLIIAQCFENNVKRNEEEESDGVKERNRWRKPPPKEIKVNGNIKTLTDNGAKSNLPSTKRTVA